jgi:hypothetical protein
VTPDARSGAVVLCGEHPIMLNPTESLSGD